MGLVKLLLRLSPKNELRRIAAALETICYQEYEVLPAPAKPKRYKGDAEILSTNPEVKAREELEAELLGYGEEAREEEDPED